jgi:isoleucyl-tRNA synthetase
MLARAASVIRQVTEAYESFQFHRVYQLVHGFCNTELSSIYLDVQKDAMYCDAVDAPRRRSGQTAMHLVSHRLVRLLAPLLAFTADEIWSHVAGATDEAEFVHLADWPAAEDQWADDELLARWDTLLEVRSAVLNKLEGLRSEGTIQSNMEAAVTLRPTSEQLAALLDEVGAETMTRLLITSSVAVEANVGGEVDEASGLPLGVDVARSKQPKCQRCWNLRPSVGADAEHPDLCDRCAEVIRQL